jgi:hypothetical protein
VSLPGACWPKERNSPRELWARAAAEQRTWVGVMDGLLLDYERIIEAYATKQAA